MISPVLSTTSALSVNIRYCGIQSWNSVSISSSESVASQAMPTSGTLSKLYVQMQSAPGGVATRIFTIVKNGADTACTCTVTGAGTTASDLSNSISYVKGDTFSLKTDFTGSPVSAQLLFSVQLDQTGQSILSGDVAQPSQTVTNYYPLQQGQVTATVPTVGSVIPTAGTISNLYFDCTSNAGAGKSWTITLVKNGVDSALTAQVTGATATFAEDTTHSVSVVQGDVVYWKIVPAGTPNNRNPSIGCIFTPTTDGESIQTYSGISNVSNSATNYQGVGGMSAWNATESSAANLISVVATTKKLTIVTANAPGVGKSYTFTGRIASADTTLVAAVTDANTTASDNTHTGTTAVGNLVSVKSVPSGTPTATPVGWGFVTYIAPDASSDGNFFLFF